MICLHVPIDYQNVSMVNFARDQKVVPAGWLLSADGPEISLETKGVFSGGEHYRKMLKQ